MSENAILKIASIIFFLFISLALILIFKDPIKGYELSVYNAISPLAWGFLITAIVGGIAIIVYQVLKRDEERGGWWIVGLSLVLLSSLIIVLLPALRGYAFSSWGDHLSHFGMVTQMLQTGHFSPGNVYPFTHTLISEYCLILNISAMDMVHFAGPIFYLLFVLFTYLLCKEMLQKPGMAILATVASTVLFLHYYIEVMPMGFAFIMFPLVFFLYLKASKGKSVGLGLLLICLIVLMPFSHPVASFMLMLALIVIELSMYSFNRLPIIKREARDSSPPLGQRISLNLSLISFIVLILWVWQQPGVWSSSVLGTYRWFQGELLKTPMVDMAAEMFTALKLQFLGQVELFFKLYGHVFIYLVLSFIAIIILVRNKTSLSVVARRSAFAFTCVFLLVVLIQGVDYIRTVTILSSGRILCLVIALLPPLVGLALYQIGSTGDKEVKVTGKLRFTKAKSARGTVIALILIICSLICIFSIYPSPLTHQANPGVTYMELNGEDWLLNQTDPDIQVIGIWNMTPRFATALLESGEPYPQWDKYVGDHFNYTQYETLGESLEKDRYLHLSKYEKLLYTELWPHIGRFTWDDFAKLGGDTSVDKLYANGEMEIWYVNGQASTK